MPSSDDQLEGVAQRIRNGEKTEPITVRALLGMFGFQRRGWFVVEWIRSKLGEHGLVTDPDFNAVWIDGYVNFRLASELAAVTEQGVSPGGEVGQSQFETVQARFVGGAVADPTHKVGKLEAASRGVTPVAPDDSIERAVTIMMSNGYSQLPVMIGERDVKGMITWESIARKLVLSGACARVSDCMVVHREISADSSLFAAIPEIAECQYVLVRDPKDKRITGIITGSDLGLQFQQLAEPFLLLGEIEHQIRRLIENRFTAVELVAAKDPGDTERTINSVADLSFGECIRLLENKDRWQTLGLKIDRIEFVKESHRIREIRNDVMHFDPDPMGVDELLALRRFATFVTDLSQYSVAPANAMTA